MKKVIHTVIVVLICASSHAQRSEIGVFLGTSYYLGELNASKHFVDVANPSGGLMYRYLLNSRYALRFNGTYGKLTGDDGLFDVGLNNFRNLSFEGDIIDASGLIEFNFFLMVTGRANYPIHHLFFVVCPFFASPLL